jgi:tRNA (guanosine-2'-O-)-methyltransferase
MTPARKERLISVLKKRQANLTVVLENVFDPHNISAVMRSCDAVGIQDIYILNTRLPSHKKWGAKSSSSAHKWLSIHQYDNADECFVRLRQKYPKVLATHLSTQATSLYAVDFTQPIAVVFGNEHEGVSNEIRSHCDGEIIIPQVGMIQSLNISVACAVVLYEAFRQKEKAGHYKKQNLSEIQYGEIWSEWSRREEFQ